MDNALCTMTDDNRQQQLGPQSDLVNIKIKRTKK